MILPETYEGSGALKTGVVATMKSIQRDPGSPGPLGRSARLAANGYARALAVSRSYLGEPLQAFQRDSTFDDNGTGQIQIEFLGKRIAIGCVEGEETRAIEFAHRFEIDTGEVLKAVSGLDDTRAMLIAGVLGQERIDELETQVRTVVPAADRMVGPDNSGDYQTTIAAMAQLIRVVRDSNFYRESNSDDHNRRLAELEAGRRLLGSKCLSVKTIKAALVGTVVYLASKFADAPIGEATTVVWNALKTLLNL